MKKRNSVIFYYHLNNHYGVPVASSPSPTEISMRKFLQRTILSCVSTEKRHTGCAGRMNGSRRGRAGVVMPGRLIQAACTGPGLSAWLTTTR
jgi:hypothetical protein